MTETRTQLECYVNDMLAEHYKTRKWSLKENIEQLATILPRDLIEAMHSVRVLGNMFAHPKSVLCPGGELPDRAACEVSVSRYLELKNRYESFRQKQRSTVM